MVHVEDSAVAVDAGLPVWSHTHSEELPEAVENSSSTEMSQTAALVILNSHRSLDRSKNKNDHRPDTWTQLWGRRTEHGADGAEDWGRFSSGASEPGVLN